MLLVSCICYCPLPYSDLALGSAPAPPPAPALLVLLFDLYPSPVRFHLLLVLLSYLDAFRRL